MRRDDARAGAALAASVRRARSCLLQRPVIASASVVAVAAGLESVCDTVFDLSQLVHWWPDVQRVRPLPAGATTTGGCALLEGLGRSRLLHIVGFKPAQRLLLVIQGEHQSTLVDLSLQRLCSARVRIDLVLEQAASEGRWARLRQHLMLAAQTAASGWALTRLVRSRLPIGDLQPATPQP